MAYLLEELHGLGKNPSQQFGKGSLWFLLLAGFIVGLLNLIRGKFEDGGSRSDDENGIETQTFLVPIVKAVGACVTLGTGNSLGPEGPSVEIGASVAKGVGNLFDKSYQRRVSLIAAGMSSVAGCFFAVESIL